ncbi:branched-chain amino acid transport system substrate-binding protein [Halolamina pelagica]|uniref:Branched-chain amino acid transport system substrate-binding protein n=2 Tax=Haloferacaceae TaxID=1644056 RepID=A0A1I5M0H7_9EURY|nr:MULTISPECIES: ABC transporter substrate-binding protein [Halolamina]SFP03032.1 branched-chain amino acid transport system substrate-binding protein [Halolamina pelagica]
MLRATGAAGVAGLAGCTDALGGGGGSMKIGVLQPVSGDLGYYGKQALWGFFSGLAYKGDTDPVEESTTGSYTVTAGDTDYELLVRDTQFSADTAQSAATDLVENESVDMLFGTASSGAAGRVIDTVVDTADVPFMAGPAASAGISSNEGTCSDIVFRASENTAMDARSGGKYVAQETDISSVYLFGADYSFGRAVVNNYEQVLSNNGVEIAGKRFVPQGYSEWEGLLDNAEEAGADGVVGGFTVATLPAMFTSYLQGDYSYSVFGGLATRITNAVVGQTLQQALGEPLTQEKIDNSGLGPFTTRYHWNQYDNDINSSFVESYTDAYGTVPDLFSSGTFTAASAIVQAVQSAGSTSGSDVAEALRGMTVTDTPKGEDGYTFQEYNNQARSAMTVADLAPTSDEWSDSWQAAIQPGEPLATIGKDETTIPADAPGMNCSL